MALEPSVDVCPERMNVVDAEAVVALEAVLDALYGDGGE